MTDLYNIPVHSRPQLEAVADILNIRLYFDGDAKAAFGNPLPDHYHVFADSDEPDVMDMIFKASIYVSLKYRERLKSLGFPVDELRNTQLIYLGCEKDYWPEMENTVCFKGDQL